MVTLKPRHIVDPNWPKQALTQYEVLAHECLNAQGTGAICRHSAVTQADQPQMVTHVALKPITGRSHQLQYMVHMGHVIIGDPIYAEGSALTIAPRQLTCSAALKTSGARSLDGLGESDAFLI